MEMFFDAHSHISIENPEEAQKYTNEHIKHNIRNSIVMVDPFLKSIKCPSDERHYVCIKPSTQTQDELYCTVCKRNVQKPQNIYRQANISLINNISSINETNKTQFLPFITSAVSQNMLKNEFDFFNSNFSGKFFGIKIYTGLSYDVLNNVRFNSNMPLLIHTAIKYYNQHPENMIGFILNYDGPVILAHFAHLEKNSIKKLLQKENVYFDCSPANLMYNTFYKNRLDSSIKKPEDLYYSALDIIGSKRLLWGTDSPFGNVGQEIDLLRKVQLTKSEYNDIVFNNAMKCMGML